MYNIVPLILILVSLLSIIVIVVRKFSVLANLDLETIQQERESRFKEQIISNKIKRYVYKYFSTISTLLKPIIERAKKEFKKIHDSAVDIKDKRNKKDFVINEDEEKNLINKLFFEIKDLRSNKQLLEVEKKYIEIIGIDSKNIKAFKGLGELYFEKKEYNESKQTLHHVLKLMEGDIDLQNYKSDNEHQLPDIYYNLSSADKMMNDYQASIINIDKALSIEPNNPRYLDMKFEISIILKNASTATNVLSRLKKVNPENNKLEDMQNQIDKIAELKSEQTVD